MVVVVWVAVPDVQVEIVEVVVVSLGHCIVDTVTIFAVIVDDYDT